MDSGGEYMPFCEDLVAELRKSREVLEGISSAVDEVAIELKDANKLKLAELVLESYDMTGTAGVMVRHAFWQLMEEREPITPSSLHGLVLEILHQRFENSR